MSSTEMNNFRDPLKVKGGKVPVWIKNCRLTYTITIHKYLDISD